MQPRVDAEQSNRARSYALSFIIGRMDAPEQAIWLAEHIPHRVRAAIARLPMESSILRVTATIDPKCLTEQQKIYWRCAADSIWEGRLAATRWLIEFVGIKQGKAGNPVRCEKDRSTRMTFTLTILTAACR